jgi:hypothetical protein
VKITCLHCAHLYEIPEGTNLAGLVCPQCATPASAHFTHEKFVRFENVEDPAYARACELARKGDLDAAFATLEEALKAGSDRERADSDPALARLRADPRWKPLLARHRKP